MTDVSDTTETGQRTSGGAAGGASNQGDAATDKLKSGFASLKSQASDKAYEFANQGKDRATGALDEAARFLEDSARTIDDKLGSQYGDYARRASESVAGLASDLKGKDVDDLIEGTRDLIRRSPAVAIGAAVATGFVIARLAKAGAGFEPETHGGGTAGRGGASQSSGGGSPSTSSEPHYPA